MAEDKYSELDEAEQIAEEQADQEAGKGNKLVLIIVIAVVLLGASGGAAYYMSGGGDDTAVAEGSVAGEEEDESGDESTDESGNEDAVPRNAFYFSLDPAFVVNFQGKSRARYLQVNIDGMTRKEDVKMDVTKHLPQIRNNMVLLLSSQEYEVLIKPEGKDSLRKDLLREINKILENETGKEDAVEDIYFTSFVMQ